MLELAADLYEHCYWEEGDVRYSNSFFVYIPIVFLHTRTLILYNLEKKDTHKTVHLKFCSTVFIFILVSPTKCVADIFTDLEMFILVCPT
jgi:hypothetical protein